MPPKDSGGLCFHPLTPSPLERAKLDSKVRNKENEKNVLSPPLEPFCIRKERRVAQMFREAIESLVTVGNLVNFELEKHWCVCVSLFPWV